MNGNAVVKGTIGALSQSNFHSRKSMLSSSREEVSVSYEGLVFIVDDDWRLRHAVTDLLESMNFTAHGFASAAEYLTFTKPDAVACLLLDLRLPDVDGLALQEQLNGLDHPPIIFITGNGDIDSSVRAMKAGAVDFLCKPFDKQRLILAIKEAFRQHASIRARRAEIGELRSRYSRLTPREREVLPLIVAGMLNKQAAAELSISEVTCQVHRGQIMKKMAVGSVADLVRMASKLEIPFPNVSVACGTRISS